MFGWLSRGLKVRSLEIENERLTEELTKYKCLDVTQKDVMLVLTDELIKLEKELNRPARSRDAIIRDASKVVHAKYEAKLSTKLRRQMNFFESIIQVMTEDKFGKSFR